MNVKSSLEITPHNATGRHRGAIGARQLAAGAVLGAVLTCCASMSLAPTDWHEVVGLVKDATGAEYIALEVLCGFPSRDVCLLPVALGALLARPCYRVFLAHGRHRRAAMPSPGCAATWVLPALFAATMVFGQSFDGCGSAEWITGGISQGIKAVLLGVGWFGLARIGLTYLFAALDRARNREAERDAATGERSPYASTAPSRTDGEPVPDEVGHAEAKGADTGGEHAMPGPSARTVALPRRYVATVCLRRARQRLRAWCARHPWVAPTLALALLWLPTLIGYAPGFVMWDTKTQLWQWFGMENHVSASMGLDPATAQTMVTQHHPPLHTVMVGLCVQAGLRFAHSAAAGALLYSVLQYALVAASFGCAFSTLRRLGVRPGVRCVVFAVVALVPVFSGYVVLMSKDVPFAAALLVLLMALVRAMRGASDRHDRVLLVLSALAASQLRSGAFAVVAVALAVACVAAWRRTVRARGRRAVWARRDGAVRGQGSAATAATEAAEKSSVKSVRSPLALLAGTLVAVLALTAALGQVVYPALGILPSSTREMLSVPAQQVARYLRDHPDGITEEERRAIGAVLDVDQLGELYKPGKSDPVKNTFNNDASSDDLARFFRAWADIVARDPASALTATAANYYGYFYPPHTVRWTYTSDFSRQVMGDISEVTAEPGSAVQLELAQPDNPLVHACDALASAYRAVWQRLPGFTLLMQAAFWCWLLVVATAYAARTRAGVAPLLAPLWLVLGMALVGPCNATTYFRYVYPIAVCLPFACALLVGAPRDARPGAGCVQTGAVARQDEGPVDGSDDAYERDGRCSMMAERPLGEAVEHVVQGGAPGGRPDEPREVPQGSSRAERPGDSPTDPLRFARVAVLIPCYNEALTVGKVIDDYRAALPGAAVYVYDNNSTDGTAAIAREHGAVVRYEPRQGKGCVVRSMFRDIEADCYLMVDGDDTYPAEQAPELCLPILEGVADMTVGDRLSNGTYAAENRRAFHGFGNNLVRGLIRIIYGYTFHDVMTGYRAMSRLFVKTMPVLSPGFQIECELSIHAVDKRWRIAEVPIVYRDRPAGSESKLSTVHDGVRVVSAIAGLFKDYRPLKFFSLVAALLMLLGLVAGVPVIVEFAATGLVTKLPSAVLAVGLVFCGALALATGAVLDTSAKNARRQWELEVLRLTEEARGRADSDEMPGRCEAPGRG